MHCDASKPCLIEPASDFPPSKGVRSNLSTSKALKQWNLALGRVWQGTPWPFQRFLGWDCFGHTICKALQTRKFLLADHNDGNDFDSNPNAIQEGWCWSTMSPRKAVTKIQDSKIGFLGDRAVESIWRSIGRLIQKVRCPYHRHTYAASLQVAHKRTKSNTLRQLALNPLKSLKNTCWGTQQSLLVMEYAGFVYIGKRHDWNDDFASPRNVSV